MFQRTTSQRLRRVLFTAWTGRVANSATGENLTSIWRESSTSVQMKATPLPSPKSKRFPLTFLLSHSSLCKDSTMCTKMVSWWKDEMMNSFGVSWWNHFFWLEKTVVVLWCLLNKKQRSLFESKNLSKSFLGPIQNKNSLSQIMKFNPCVQICLKVPVTVFSAQFESSFG